MVIGVEAHFGGEHGSITERIPFANKLQDDLLASIATKIEKVKADTEALQKTQQEESARAAERHAEAMAEQKRLERLVVDAAAGGAPAVRAVADIRDLLRPGNPEIDGISAEQLPGLVKRILEDLQKPSAKPDDFSGTVKRTLTEAQAQEAELKFADAAQVVEAELARAETEDQDRARGRAALLAERGRIARLQLHYREAAAFYGKAADSTAFDTAESWAHKLDAASALEAQGDEFGDNPALLEAILAYRSALDVATRQRAPLDWATTQDNLGNALWRLGERESGTARLEEAVAAYRLALEERTRQRVPLDWAMTQNNLGNALEALGERESGTTRLDEAVTAYRLALEERTRQRVPLDWAMSTGNQGVALMALAERLNDITKMKVAVEYIDSSLTTLRDGGHATWAAYFEAKLQKARDLQKRLESR